MKIFKEKLDSYESKVPDGVWDEVEARLFPEKVARPRFMPWVWAFAAAAALALGVFFGVRLVDNGNGQVERTEDNRIAVSPTSPDTNPSSSVDNEGGQASPADEPIRIIPAPERSAIAAVVPTATELEGVKAAGETFVPQEAVIDDVAAVPEEVTEEEVKVEEVAKAEEVVVTEKVDQNKDQNQDKVKDQGFKTDHDGEDWSGYMSATNDRVGKGQRNPSMGLSLSRAASSSQYENTLDTKMFFLGVASNWEAETKSDNIYTRTTSTSVTKDEDHRRPFRMSLMLEFPLNDVFSLESGLAYSILHSSFKTSSGIRVSEESQVLGYLGIPLNLKANLWDKDVFTVYATAGGMVEKCVSGVSKTSVSVSGVQNGDVVRNTFAVKPLALSVNGSAGMQINLPGGFGVYAEPGVSYHFADNSKVRSIYSEKPFDFILTFGARYSFR